MDGWAGGCCGITNVLLENSHFPLVQLKINDLENKRKKDNQICHFSSMFVNCCEKKSFPVVPSMVLSHYKLWDRRPLSEFCSCVPLGGNKKDYVERHRWYYNITHFMSNAWSLQTKSDKSASYEVSSWWLMINLCSSRRHCKSNMCFKAIFVSEGWWLIIMITA